MDTVEVCLYCIMCDVAMKAAEARKIINLAAICKNGIFNPEIIFEKLDIISEWVN